MMIGRPDLADDPSLSTPQGQLQRADEIEGALGAWFKDRSKHEIFQEALKHLRDAIRAQPDFPKAYYDIGSIWLSQNKLPEAGKAFQAVIRFDPNDLVS